MTGMDIYPKNLARMPKIPASKKRHYKTLAEFEALYGSRESTRKKWSIRDCGR